MKIFAAVLSHAGWQAPLHAIWRTVAGVLSLRHVNRSANAGAVEASSGDVDDLPDELLADVTGEEGVIQRTALRKFEQGRSLPFGFLPH